MRRLICIAIIALGSVGASTAAGQSLIVVNQGDASVSVVNLATLSVEARIDERQEGRVHAHEVAVSPDGRTAYVPVYGDTGVGLSGVDGRTLLFVDIPAHAVVGALDFGRGVRPHHPVVDPNTGLLYVTTELDGSVAIIDPGSRAVVGRVPTGAPQSHMLVLSHDGRLGFTANVAPGSVSVLDLKARTTLSVIPVAESIQRIAVSKDDRLVFTSDATRPRMAVIDVAARSVRQWITLPGLGFGAAPTRDGRWLLVALPRLDQVGVIDLRAMALVRTIKVGKGPQETVIQPDGQRAYVSCAGDGAVSVIDLTTWTVIGAIPTASGADGVAWAAR